MTNLRELLDTALFPIERPDFFENAAEYYDIIEQTVKEWLQEVEADTKKLEKKAEWTHQKIHLQGQLAVLKELIASLSSKATSEGQP